MVLGLCRWINDRLGCAHDRLCIARCKGEVPKSIVASGGKFAYPDDAEETPDTLTAVYEFDGFNMLWEHATGINDGPYQRDHGVAFIGNNGTLVVDRGGWEVIPEVINGQNRMEAVGRQKKVDDGLALHTKNFIDTVKSRKIEDLKCPIQVAAHVATVCQMGNIAFRWERKFIGMPLQINSQMKMQINILLRNITTDIHFQKFEYLPGKFK